MERGIIMPIKIIVILIAFAIIIIPFIYSAEKSQGQDSKEHCKICNLVTTPITIDASPFSENKIPEESSSFYPPLIIHQYCDCFINIDIKSCNKESEDKEKIFKL